MPSHRVSQILPDPCPLDPLLNALSPEPSHLRPGAAAAQGPIAAVNPSKPCPADSVSGGAEEKGSFGLGRSLHASQNL